MSPLQNLWTATQVAFRRGGAVAPSLSPEARGGLPPPGIAAPSRSAEALSAAGRSGHRDRIRPARRAGGGTCTVAPGADPLPPPGRRGEFVRGALHSAPGPAAAPHRSAPVPPADTAPLCACPTRGHRTAPCLSHPRAPLRTFLLLYRWCHRTAPASAPAGGTSPGARTHLLAPACAAPCQPCGGSSIPSDFGEDPWFQE